MFKNMKIGMRLGLGFGMVVLLMIAIAIIGITQLSNLSDKIESVVNDKYPKTTMAHDIIDDVNIVARAMRNILIMDKQEQINKEISHIHDAVKSINELHFIGFKFCIIFGI